MPGELAALVYALNVRNRGRQPAIGVSMYWERKYWTRSDAGLKEEIKFGFGQVTFAIPIGSAVGGWTCPLEY